MKVILGVLFAAILIIVVVGMNDTETVIAPESEVSEVATENSETMSESNSAVSNGSYLVNAETSKVQWAGKRPLVEGYINSGSLGIKEGTFSVIDEVVTGSFVIDMNTLAVSSTAKKPGKESMLEEHLKSSNWFDVDSYPTATFEITEALQQSETSVYAVTGNLTMKGQTHELTFPATITEIGEGNLMTEASLEFDRTKWGITAGSGSFFDNLADNVIDDMVGLSFSVISTKTE